MIEQILSGWIQKAPEMRFTPKGTPVTSFTISCPAGDEVLEDGTKKKAYTYVRCSCWNELAEDVNENYNEGDLVQVSGILKAGKPWTPKDGGEARSAIEFTFFKVEHIK
jgi:single-strand DNA-binding protein